MLDQNTDRMWYVIGAVLIGAAIIFGMNTLMPNTFASVTSMFDLVTQETNERIEKYTYGDNLVTEYVIYNHSDAHGRTDISDYVRSNRIVVESYGSHYGGMYLHMSDLDLKPSTEYRLSYNFKKLDGTLVHIGGHTDGAFLNNHYYVNGLLMDNSYGGAVYDDMYSDEVKDTDELQSVEMFFITPDEFDGSGDFYDGRISIQPNRYMRYPVTIEITNLSLSEVL